MASLFDEGTVDSDKKNLELGLVIAKKDLGELQDRVNANKEQGKKITNSLVFALDDKELEINELEEQLLSIQENQKDAYFELQKSWEDIASSDLVTRLKCRTFFEKVIQSIEITSVKRGNKLIRVEIQDRVIMAFCDSKKKNGEYSIKIIDGVFERSGIL